jgi:hypothetical protein
VCSLLCELRQKRRRKEEGGRRKEEGGRRKEEGGKTEPDGGKKGELELGWVGRVDE